jgi:hypothetical protein
MAAEGKYDSPARSTRTPVSIMNRKKSMQNRASHQCAMWSMNRASGSASSTPAWAAVMIRAASGQQRRRRLSGFFFVPLPG